MEQTLTVEEAPRLAHDFAPLKVAFSNFWHPPTPEAIRANALYQLLSRRFTLELSDDPAVHIFSCFQRRHRPFKRRDCVRVFYSGENVRADLRACDFAFGFEHPTTDRQYRLPLYRLYFREYELASRARAAVTGATLKFCNFVYSNPRCTVRNRFFNLLSRYRQVDAGGRLFNNIGGPVVDKLEFQRGYKFTIAFENASAPGYTTEKLLQALVAGTVPIYWGNPLAGLDFNPRAFINCHDFPSLHHVVEHVRAVDADDRMYRAYLAEPIFAKGVEPEFLRENTILDAFARAFAATPRPSRRWW